MKPSGPSSERLPRTLGLWSSVALVIGITIGSGIFRSPAGIAQKVPSPMLVIALWVVGGLVTLCGALSLAELAAAMPETGGFYAYLREGWGRPAAFCFGWSELVLIRASALGGIAVVFGEYLLRSLGVDPVEHYIVARALSAGAIAFAACANIVGANVGRNRDTEDAAADYIACIEAVGGLADTAHSLPIARVSSIHPAASQARTRVASVRCAGVARSVIRRETLRRTSIAG
jgi:amino acid transporter